MSTRSFPTFPQKNPDEICLNIKTFSETETRNLNLLPEIAYHNENIYFNYLYLQNLQNFIMSKI